MADRRNKGKYEVCQDCGAHLDHGEQCDCESSCKEETEKDIKKARLLTQAGRSWETVHIYI